MEGLWFSLLNSDLYIYALSSFFMASPLVLDSCRLVINPVWLMHSPINFSSISDMGQICSKIIQSMYRPAGPYKKLLAMKEMRKVQSNIDDGVISDVPRS